MVRSGIGARVAAKSFLGLVLIFLAACTPTVQSARTPLADFQGPHFDAAAERFYSFDGAPLGLSAWLPPKEQAPWAVIVGLHGMNDYGQAFAYAGPWFAARGVAVYAYDARGFGRSPDRGVWAGQQLMMEDVRTAVNVARRAYPDAILAVVGDSMGSAAAIATFASQSPPEVDRLILTAPAVWGWSEMPNTYALTLWAGAHVFPWRAVTPPRGVQRRIQASDNIQMLRALGRDSNMLFETRVDALYGLVSLMDTAQARTGELSGHVAYLYGARDQIIPRAAARRAAQRLPADARTAMYANGYHMLLRDLQAEVVYRDILTYLHDPEAPFPSGAPPLRRVIQANR